MFYLQMCVLASREKELTDCHGVAGGPPTCIPSGKPQEKQDGSVQGKDTVVSGEW